MVERSVTGGDSGRLKISKGSDGQWWVQSWFDWSSCACHRRWDWALVSDHEYWEDALADANQRLGTASTAEADG